MDSLIPIALFIVVFGIFYLFLSTRNKERLALIEKGVDAGIFMKGKTNYSGVGKIIILNISLLLMGIGIGTFVALLLRTYTIMNDAIFPAAIFMFAGLGLFIGFYMTKRIEKQ